MGNRLCGGIEKESQDSSTGTRESKDGFTSPTKGQGVRSEDSLKTDDSNTLEVTPSLTSEDSSHPIVKGPDVRSADSLKTDDSNTLEGTPTVTREDSSYLMFKGPGVRSPDSLKTDDSSFEYVTWRETTPRPDVHSTATPGRVYISNKLATMTKLSDETIRDEDCDIRSSAFLGNRLVLCDYRNKRLIILDENKKYVREIKFSSNPTNITKVGTNKVAVLFPKTKRILDVNLGEELFDETKATCVDVPENCEGCTYVGGSIYYAVKPQYVYYRFKIQDSRYYMVGENQKQIDYAFQNPVSLFGVKDDISGKVLYIACNGDQNKKATVVKYPLTHTDTATQIDMRVTMEKEIVPMKLENQIYSPKHITLDKRGNVFICGEYGIHMVDHSGKYDCQLEEVGSDIKCFEHINFCPSDDDTFIATTKGSNKLYVYQLKTVDSPCMG